MTPDFLSTWRLDVTPLSPVHVGSGEDVDPTGYVLDADALYEFSPSALAVVLDEADRSRLLGLVDGAQDERALTGVRKFLFEQRAGLVAHASRAVRAAPGVRELYEQRIGTVAQTETRAINKLEIERVFSHPDTRAPILPGSSLKGAIRTALLDRENDGRDLEQGEDSRKLQQRLFSYGGFETDPMRLVHVEDAMGSGGRATDDLIADTSIVFAVNRKKRKITNEVGREVRSQAEQKGPYQTLEVVSALRWRAFRGGLRLHAPSTDLHAHQRLPKPSLRWSAADIAEACNRFYRRSFAREMKALHERDLLDERWHGTMRKLMTEGLGELLDSNRAFLLRVGRHSGAESVTLDGVRSIRIMMQQGEVRQGEEATTWWLASDRTDASTDLLPFGWVLVEMAEGDGDPAPRPGIAELLDSFHAESGERKWRAEVMQRRATLRQEQETQTAKRIDAERRRREQEAEEREREAKRATMTDEERELDELRRRLDAVQGEGASRQGQGGELAGRAIEVLKAAREWPEPVRLQAADLVERAFEWIGYPKGKKGRERKQQILDLREGAR